MDKTTEKASQFIGQGCSGLDGGALAAGGTTKEMGNGGPQEYERGHAGRDGRARRMDSRADLGMDLVEDEIVAAFDGAAKVVIDQAYGEAREGEEGNDPAMGFAGVGGPVQGDEKDGGGGACEDAGKGGEDEPADGVEEDRQAVGESLELIQQWASYGIRRSHQHSGFAGRFRRTPSP